MKTSHAIAFRRRARQRGTAYVLVLSITTMLVVLGIAATQLARNSIERNDLQQGQSKARLSAEYMQDYLHKLLDGNSTWRDSAANLTWTYFDTINDTHLFYGFKDEIDGDIRGDYTQAFRMYTLAIDGSTSRIYSCEYVPGEGNSLTRNDTTWRQETFAK